MFALIVFDNDGTIATIEKFGTEGLCENAGVELAPSAWHTILALTPLAVALELKAGPFQPGVAKEPAPWAPEEGTEAGTSYLAFLRHAVGVA